MSTILSWVIPITAYLVAWRIVFRTVLVDMTSGYDPDGDDVLLAALLATITALFAPLVIVGGLLWVMLGRNPTKVARRLGGESRKTKVERLEQEARDRERHIADLERRLGVGGSW